MYKPSLDENAFNGHFQHYYAFRVGTKYQKHKALYFGTEFHKRHLSGGGTRINESSIGLFGRYTFWEDKGFRPFLELNPQIIFINIKF